MPLNPVADEAPRTSAAAAPDAAEYLSTVEAAEVAGFTVATLRNYAWLLTLSPQARSSRLLQAPPDGLPRPTRERGRLRWPKAEMLEFAQTKQK